jgi:hypothetical protein
VHPYAVTAGRYESALAEIGEMTGHRRLRNAEAVVDVADAHFVVPEEGKDSKTASCPPVP